MLSEQEEIQIVINNIIEMIYELYLKDLKNRKLKNGLQYSK